MRVRPCNDLGFDFGDVGAAIADVISSVAITIREDDRGDAEAMPVASVEKASSTEPRTATTGFAPVDEADGGSANRRDGRSDRITGRAGPTIRVEDNSVGERLAV